MVAPNGGDVRMVLAEDHATARAWLRRCLDGAGGGRVVAEVADGAAAVAAAGTEHPNVVIMDVGLPEMNGILATRRIRTQNPDVVVLGLSGMIDRWHVLAMLEAGASGYLCKRNVARELGPALQAVLSGGTYISSEIWDASSNAQPSWLGELDHADKAAPKRQQQGG